MDFVLAARIAGALSLLTLIPIYFLIRPPKFEVIPLDLPASEDEIRGLLGVEGAPGMAKDKLRYDSWFIGTYVPMFLAWAALHWYQDVRGGIVLAVVTAILALATAALDLAENRSTRGLIDRYLADAPTLGIRGAYRISAAKWMSYFLLLIAIAPLFARSTRSLMLLADVFALVGLTGVVASIALFVTPSARSVVAKALVASVVPLLIGIGYLLLAPLDLLPRAF